MKYFLSFFWCSLLLISSSYSQSISELQDKIASSSGLEKVQYQLQLSNKIVDSDSKQAFDLALEALKNTGGNTNLEGAANALAAQASVNLKSYDEAISFGKVASSIYKTSDKNNYAMSESVVAEALEGKGKNTEAVGHYETAFSTYKSIGKNKNAGFNASSIGAIYNSKKDTKKAIEWYGKAAVEFEKAGREKDEVQCLKTVGALYSNYGDFSKAKSSMEAALAKADKYGLSSIAEDIQKSLDMVLSNELSAESKTDFQEDKNKETENFISEIKMQNAK